MSAYSTKRVQQVRTLESQGIGEKGLSMQRVKGTEELSMTETAVTGDMEHHRQERTYSLWRYECGPGAQCGEVNSFNFFKMAEFVAASELSCKYTVYQVASVSQMADVCIIKKRNAVGCGIIQELNGPSLCCVLLIVVRQINMLRTYR